MARWLTLIAVFLFAAAPSFAGEITGKYIEARTCEVFTGPCFANADTSLTGKHGVMAWMVEKGDGLDGLGVVAVIAAADTLGQRQVGEGKAVLIVDVRANAAQREALIRLAKQQGGELVKNVVAIEFAKVELEICPCKENGCARLVAGSAKIETRCIDPTHDKSCDNAFALYPPLAKDVTQPRAAVAVEHSFSGKGFNETWKDMGQRAAYLGTFSIR